MLHKPDISRVTDNSANKPCDDAKYLATYWARQNIRVNAISPGGIYTGQPEEFVARLTDLIPMGRMADKDEYKSAIIFLCSNASGYMNGQNLIMDGGRTVL